jgi:hypothetical protein
MKHWPIAACLALLAIASVASANDAVYEQHLAKGVLALESENADEAVKEFKASLREKPDDPKTLLYLGIAQSRIGDREAEGTLKKALALSPNNARSHLELGIHYFRSDRADEAATHFDRAAALAPGSEVAAKAASYRSASAESAARSRWAGGASVAYQYDSNVTLTPDGVPLAVSSAGQKDWSTVLQGRGRYTILEKPGGELSAGAGVYKSLHTDLGEYNVGQYAVDLRGSLEIAGPVSLKGSYVIEYVDLGQTSYSSSNALTPSVLVREGEGMSTALEYRWRRTNFMDAPLFPTNSERTGTNHALAVTQNARLGRFVALKAGFALDRDLTRTDVWDYSGRKLLIDAKADLPGGFGLGLGWEWYRRTYGGVDPSEGVARKDTAKTWTAVATARLKDPFTLAAAYSWVDSWSNIPSYKFTRGITTLSLNARF